MARTLLRLARWRAEGTLPRRGILIGAPHTSNWDLVLAVLLLWALGARVRVLVKREAFWWPLGPVLRRLGAIPTERRGGGGLVARMVAEADADEEFLLAIAAEGTRSRTEHWRSGFYRLATGTGLAVTLGYVDGPRRVVGAGPTLVMTGDVGADMDRIREFYADKRGVRPGRAGVPRLREEDA
ncbi:1-acyl-sn-glycerol-3-phosphate acyltransferase [Cellulomonas bogoriensis]|uniref:Acyl-phosphate glycerol 3-phosphate acyltransferase n=1 Tax=Cellulomonas bogoriensis 69B4 = DSM 16987 TaxID=1386082 RepID=A0A0A0BTT5_9CELL|nr:1-acyl-sn-glycerol-3-phosphate acyltransferase [Cellulomonas bogoriensis]KGM11803.1 acyl-phosphate glycerol 3-phosphate acyltransferase [Cellulomonas bogoriensis 69B4 = DSM 16987]